MKGEGERGMIQNYLDAGYPALWVETLELERAFRELLAEATNLNYTVANWDVRVGFVNIKANKRSSSVSPIAVAEYLTHELPDQSVLFVRNFHKFITSIDVIQSIQNEINKWKATGRCLVVLSPVADIPIELERLFMLVPFDLPSEETIKERIKYIANSSSIEVPSEAEANVLIENAKGLTAFEIENALSMSVIKHGKFDSHIILDQKAQLVRKNSTLELSQYKEDFSTLGGLDNLKSFALDTVTSPLSRGIMLLGVPGTGKTHFCKALGNEVGLPTITLDFGRVYGSKVGQSEAQIRQALKTVDAMSPCILMIDEMEKGLSGIGSSNNTDGGTSSRVFGAFLQWLQDHTSKVYTIATVNSIDQLPDALLRSERWDAIFFIDLPTKEERTSIFNIWSKYYGVDEEEPELIVGWTGAEIRTMLRLAAIKKKGLSDAKKCVVPLYYSRKTSINNFRQQTLQFALPASSQSEVEGEERARRIAV